MLKKILSKRPLAILLTLAMLLNGIQFSAAAAGANGVRDEQGRWTYAYYLGQEYLGNAPGAPVKPDPVGYGFQGVITSITFTDDNKTSWTFHWNSEANGEWRITGNGVSERSAKAWPQITDGKIYVGYCGDKAYTFTLGNEGSSATWTYANSQNRHANWFRYIRFIREYTVNVFYQNETGTIEFQGETFAAAAPVTGSFQFLYPDGGIIDDSEWEDGEYTAPTTLLPADFLPQSMVDQGYEIKYATDADGNNVLTVGVTISLLGDNVLNVYCTLIPPATEDYKIVHNYYVEGTLEGTQDGGTIEVTEGSNFDEVVTGIEKKTSYDGKDYAYTNYTVDPNGKVITLTYARELPTYDYSVIYDANFGDNDTAADEENVTGTKATSKNITVDANMFSRPNYYFAGWNTARDGSGTAYAAGSTIALTAANNSEVLYAQWQEYPKYDYIVTYYANFGANQTKADGENVTQVYDTSKTITVDSNPFNRANYTFLGWATEADGEVVYQAGDQISFTEGGSEELFAVWQENPKYSYAVSYNGNGGTLTGGEVVYADEENISDTYSTVYDIEVNANTFSRAHYTFIGWNTKADGTGTDYTAEDVIALDIQDNTETLYAQWEEHPKYDYTVIYNANFGANALKTDSESVAQVYDTTKTITVDENTFVRENYTFLGWATEADGEVVYQAGDQISFTEGGSEELFAVWQEYPKYDYSVIYNANFGDNETKADAENVTQVYDTTKTIEIDENTFVRENYTFIGWSETENGEVVYLAGDLVTFTEGGEKTLYAQWIEHDKYNYTVIYNGNGGTLADDTVSYGDSENLVETYATSHNIIVDGNTFIREHYTFIGWNTEADGTGIGYTAEEVIALTAQVNTMTLYAQWEEHPKYDYSVIYNANFGDNETKADAENVTQVYDTSKTIEVDENTFVRENYTFLGWAAEADGEVVYQVGDEISFTEGGSEELFAVWQENAKYDYSVIYNANFDNNETKADAENVTQVYDTSKNITVDENTFVREGYTFAGWNTEADGTGTAYNAEDVIALTAQENTETLYAQWDQDEEEPPIEIPDEDVPTTDIPKTGDTMVVYAALTTMSGLGLATLGLKKKKESEE